MKLKIGITILLLFTSCLYAQSQESVYIPSTSTVHVGNTQSVGMFGHFINDGNFSILQNGRVYFLGKIFKNNPTALLTDGSTLKNSKQGGNIIFQQPNPVYGNLGQQLLESGYSDGLLQGPSFSSITINNPDGVWLMSDMNVLDAVNFQRGHVYLQKFIAALGDSTDFGGVNGHSPERYFVTGTATNGGALKISSLEACCIVTYPIGPTNTEYTPLQIRVKGGKKDVYARAFRNVYSNATTGTILTDTTLKVTWSLFGRQAGLSEVEMLVQNDKDVETQTFTAHRNKSYISLYKPNGWEKLSIFSTPQSPGTITSAAAIYTAMMHFRTVNIDNSPLYITKRAMPEKIKLNITNAFSPNGDGINDRWNLPFLESFANCRVQIFNRHGQVIFSSVGYNNPWDGTINGNTAPVGTYYYIIDLRNGETPVSGYVVLLR